MEGVIDAYLFTICCMKKHYELVCVIDSRLSMEEIRTQQQAIESHLSDMKVDLDDMGLMTLSYPLKGQNQAYFLSYYLSAEGSRIDGLKSELLLEKSLLKFHIFSMRNGEKFMKFSELKKAYQDSLPEVEEAVDVSEEVVSE